MLLRSICISLLMMMSFINTYASFWCSTVLLPLLDHILVKEHLDKLQRINIQFTSERIAICLAICEITNILNLCLNTYGFIEQFIAILNSACISVLIVNALQQIQNDSLYCKWIFKANTQKYFDFCISSYPSLMDTIYTNFKRNIILEINNSKNLIIDRLTQQTVIYFGVILLIFINLGWISTLRYILLIFSYNYIRAGLQYINHYGLNGSTWQCSHELSISLLKKSKIQEMNDPVLPYSLISCFILAHRSKSWNQIKENFKEDAQIEAQMAQQQITQELYILSLPLTIILSIVLTL